jgi:hypothetical protein
MSIGKSAMAKPTLDKELMSMWPPWDKLAHCVGEVMNQKGITPSALSREMGLDFQLVYRWIVRRSHVPRGDVALRFMAWAFKHAAKSDINIILN